MQRLLFPQMLAELEKELLRDNFRRVGGEVFIGAEPAVISPWLSLAGNDFSFNPVLGVCSKSIDEIVRKALRKAAPGSARGRLAVPLFRVTPERISPGDRRIIRLRTGVPGYDAKEVAGFSEWLREIGYAFLSRHLTLEGALELALKWNRGDQAQQYYTPALMLLLGRRNDKDAYARDVISTYGPEAGEVASVYKQFSRELDAVVAEKLRNTE
jgi:hypothetical protein